MRVPVTWLSEWIDLPESQSELMERLTLAGLEVGGVEHVGPDLSALCVGHVIERRPHPNADRLSLCRVDLGADDPVEIVCGAPNVASGQTVAVAPAGTTLPDGTRVKKSKIRGVVSRGMICSERELGLGPDHEGILVLDSDASPGTPLDRVLRGGETVLDVEITPNRGDWASMVGIAREVRAQFGGSLRVPPHEPEETGSAATRDIGVKIEDAEGCYRYLGRVVRGVTVGPSPDWLCRKLEAAGLRAINVVVDVTNLVLLEFGQPLHAFDLHRIQGGEIRVRAAGAGERITTLDGQVRELDPADLVIADAKRAVAIAGVMGGAETEVREDTRDILLESAQFHPVRVRATARRLGLHSESSYRFERGVDPEGVRRGIDRAALLLAELAGGSVAAGIVEATGASVPRVEEVVLDPAHPNRLLGTALSTEEVVTCLGRVGIRAALDAENRLRCRIPSYRNDVRLAEDLVEEVARAYGYDRIPTTMPECRLESVHEPPRHTLESRVRDGLRAAGLLELRTFPAIARADLAALRLPEDDPRLRTVHVLNPIAEEESELRTTIVPSLLRAARRNLAHQIDRVKIFEVSRRFLGRDNGELPDEPACVAAVVVRSQGPSLWAADIPVFFEAKGIAELLLRQIAGDVEFRAGGGEPYLHPGVAVDVLCRSQRLGSLGELHPEVAAHYEIDVPCAVFEFDLAPLLEQEVAGPAYREVSRQPAVRRDVAVLLARDQPAGEVLEAIRKTGGSELVSVQLFDRYEGKGVPDGKVSLAFRMVIQRPDRTLEDSEITKFTDRVRQMLVHRFGGELR